MPSKGIARTFYTDIDLWNKALEIARSKGQSISEVLTRFLREYVAEFEGKEVEETVDPEKVKEKLKEEHSNLFRKMLRIKGKLKQAGMLKKLTRHVVNQGLNLKTLENFDELKLSLLPGYFKEGFQVEFFLQMEFYRSLCHSLLCSLFCFLSWLVKLTRRQSPSHNFSYGL